MIWALLDAQNVVINIIEFDGVSNYIPEDGLILAQIDDTAKIGDTFVP